MAPRAGLQIALLLAALVIIQGALAEYTEYEDVSDWGYGPENGPCTWKKNYPQCKGKRQSPIALHHKTATNVCGPPLHWFNFNSMPCTVLIGNNGRTLLLRGIWDCHEPPSVKLGNCTYMFENLHFHWGSATDKGSEHTIDGERFPLELQAVHVKKPRTKRDAAAAAAVDDHEVLVLVYLFRICDEDKSACRQKICYRGEPSMEHRNALGYEVESSLRGGNEDGGEARPFVCPHSPKGSPACDECKRKMYHDENDSDADKGDAEHGNDGQEDEGGEGNKNMKCTNCAKRPNPNGAMEPFSLNSVVREFSKVKRAGSTVSIDPFLISSLIPRFEKNFFLYKGSLTTPPCTENVLYAVSGKVLCVSRYEMMAFRQLVACGNTPLVDNYRQLQRRCHRPINFVDNAPKSDLQCPPETSTQESSNSS